MVGKGDILGHGTSIHGRFNITGIDFDLSISGEFTTRVYRSAGMAATVDGTHGLKKRQYIGYKLGSIATAGIYSVSTSAAAFAAGSQQMPAITKTPLVVVLMVKI